MLRWKLPEGGSLLRLELLTSRERRGKRRTSRIPRLLAPPPTRRLKTGAPQRDSWALKSQSQYPGGDEVGGSPRVGGARTETVLSLATETVALRLAVPVRSMRWEKCGLTQLFPWPDRMAGQEFCSAQGASPFPLEHEGAKRALPARNDQPVFPR